MKYAALLRGINVGGNNKLPMKQLAALFDAEKCTGVVTYIQSGNVVFDAPAAVAAKLPERISAAILRSHELTVPVVLRSARELRAVVDGNPFLKKKGVDEDSLYVMFLADAPRAADVKALDPNRSPGDEFVVNGKDVYFRLPNGAGRSKLTNQYFDSRLKTVSTSRNWRTVLKLLELTGS